MKHSLEPTIPAKWLSRLGQKGPVALLLFATLVPATLFATASTRSSKRKPVTESTPPKAKAAGAAVLLALAQKQLDHNNLATAAEYAIRAAKEAPELDDYANYVRAEAQSRARNSSEVSKAVARVLEHNPVSPLTGPAAAIAVQSDLDTDNPKEALDLLRKFYVRIPQPQGDFLLARAFQATGDLPQSAEYFQRVYYGYPKSSDAADAQNFLNDLKTKLGENYPPPMAAAMLGRAMKLIQAGDYSGARNELNSVIPQLGGMQREIASVRLGEIFFFERDYPRAKSYLESLQLSQGEADAERLDYLTRSALKVDQNAPIDAYLNTLAQKYSQSSYRLDLLLTIGNQALVDNDTNRSMQVFSACAASFPFDSGAAWCHWRVAFEHYRKRDPGTFDQLREFLFRFPGSNEANASLYFLGRLSEEHNDFAAARAYFDAILDHYPNTYYAVEARIRLREPRIHEAEPLLSVLEFLKSVEWRPRPQSPTFVPDRNAQKRLARARLLHLAVLDDWAELELRFAATNDGGQPYVYAYELAKIASERGATDQSIRYIKSVAPSYLLLGIDDAPLSFWHFAFPLPYRAQLYAYSRQNQLSPYLVAALIRQESEFNPTVISHAHAYGLMQVLPTTGRQLARQLRIRRFSSRDLLLPTRNLQMGTLYFRTLLDMLSDHEAEALAAFNAGKSRVDRWSSWGPFSEPAEFIETIPFIETRNYVQIVLRNADVYRRLYEGSASATDGGEVPHKSAPHKAVQHRARASADLNSTLPGHCSQTLDPPWRRISAAISV
jgi:soluble lytic murein transglycosylase